MWGLHACRGVLARAEINGEYLEKTSFAQGDRVARKCPANFTMIRNFIRKVHQTLLRTKLRLTIPMVPLS